MASEPARSARFLRFGPACGESPADYLSAALRQVLSSCGADRLGLRGRVRAEGPGYLVLVERGASVSASSLPADALGKKRRARPAALDGLIRAATGAVRTLVGRAPEDALPAGGLEAALGLRALAATLSAIEARGGRVLPSDAGGLSILAVGVGAAFGAAAVRFGIPVRVAMPVLLAVVLAPLVPRLRGLRVRTGSGAVLAVTDRVEGTAYAMTFAAGRDARTLRLDLAGMRADEDPARLAILAGEAVDALGLGR